MQVLLAIALAWSSYICLWEACIRSSCPWLWIKVSGPNSVTSILKLCGWYSVCCPPTSTDEIYTTKACVASTMYIKASTKKNGMEDQISHNLDIIFGSACLLNL